MQTSDMIPFAAPSGAKFPMEEANRIVRSLWIGDLSPLEWVCMQSFVRCGHEFQLFMYQPTDKVPAGVVVRDAHEILPAGRVFQNRLGKGKGSFAGFSDLFRYHMLRQLGGWWVDMDVFCLAPFDFSAPFVLGAELDKPVATGVLKTPAGSELMQKVCRKAEAVDPSRVLWNELCDCLTQSVSELGLLRHVLPVETFSPIVWNQIPDYVRGRRQFVPEGQTLAVHLYHEMWRRHKLDKWACHGPNSVLEILKRHAGIDPLDAMPGVAPAAKSVWSRWLPWRRAA